MEERRKFLTPLGKLYVIKSFLLLKSTAFARDLETYMYNIYYQCYFYYFCGMGKLE